MANDNCLEGIQCPCCGNEDLFHIEARATFSVRDDGTDDFRGVEWSDRSDCGCGVCCNAGMVRTFRIGGKEWMRRYHAALEAGDRDEEPSLTRGAMKPKGRKK